LNRHLIYSTPTPAYRQALNLAWYRAGRLPLLRAAQALAPRAEGEGKPYVPLPSRKRLGGRLRFLGAV